MREHELVARPYREYLALLFDPSEDAVEDKDVDGAAMAYD